MDSFDLSLLVRRNKENPGRLLRWIRPFGVAPPRLFLCGGDPVSGMLRKKSMYQEMDIDRCKPRLAVAKRTASGLSVNQTVSKRAVSMSATTSRPDWVELMERIRDHRDQPAFRAVFDHFAPRVKAFLMKSGLDAAQAEECAQDVLATVWRKAHLFDPSRATLPTWIFTIARNRKIDVLRRDRRPEPEDLTWGPEAEPAQDAQVALQQETAILGAALAALPGKQRELIEKAYFGDLSHSEIAAETGLPLGTIKSRIRLALDRLRHSMG